MQTYSHTAYLNVWIKYSEDGLPVIVSAGIYSAPPWGLTFDQRMGCAILAQAKGDSYEECISRLLQLADSVPSMRWTLPYLKKQNETIYLRTFADLPEKVQ